MYSLVVFLGPSQPLKAQVSSVVRSTYYQLRLVCQLCPFLARDSLVIVILKLDNCNALHVGLAFRIGLEAAARVLSETLELSHVTPVPGQ